MARPKPNIPNFIYCSITGQRFAVRRDVLLQRIKAAGSLERLQKTYVCRDARRMVKEGRSLEDIRKELGYDPEHANTKLTFDVARGSSSMAKVRIQSGDTVDTFWRDESWRVSEDWNRHPMSDAEIAKTTQDTCLNPPRWYDHDCKGCQFYKQCTMLTKGVYRK